MILPAELCCAHGRGLALSVMPAVATPPTARGDAVLACSTPVDDDHAEVGAVDIARVDIARPPGVPGPLELRHENSTATLSDSDAAVLTSLSLLCGNLSLLRSPGGGGHGREGMPPSIAMFQLLAGAAAGIAS